MDKKEIMDKINRGDIILDFEGKPHPKIWNSMGVKSPLSTEEVTEIKKEMKDFVMVFDSVATIEKGVKNEKANRCGKSK
jgi:hypothetical protein